MSWYYAIGQEQKGPVEEEELQQLRSAGDIGEDTLVWKEGMAEWTPLSEAMGGATPTAAAGGVATTVGGENDLVKCAYSGESKPRGEMIKYGDSYVAPAYKDAFVQRLQEGGDADASQMQYAGFWIRFGGKMIDQIILSVGFYAVFFLCMIPAIAMAGNLESGDPPPPAFFVFMMLGYVLGIGLMAGYVTWMVGKWGATLGKMAVGVRVVNADGSKCSYLKAFGRFWGEMVTGFTFAIGYIIAAFDDEKRTLHDHICSTRVVMKR